MASPGSTRRARRGRSSCPCLEAARSASPSTRPTPTRSIVGLREGGVRRSVDGGRTWVDCTLPEPGVFSLAVSAADGAVYAGTEPSRLFRSDDRGESWSELDALLELPSRPNWSFPPRPWTSHVRWIAPSPHDADLLLVGIELGGLMRSGDGGAELAGPPPRRATGRALARLAPAHTWSRVRSRRRRRRLQHGRGRDLAAGGRGSRPPLHLVGHRRPGRPRLLVRLGEHRPLRRPRPRRSAGAHLPATRRRTLAAARRRPPRAATGDAVCARRDRWPPLRRSRRRPALGEPRSRRQLARLHSSEAATCPRRPQSRLERRRMAISCSTRSPRLIDRPSSWVILNALLRLSDGVGRFFGLQPSAGAISRAIVSSIAAL